ncbi:MAG: hypothetical protein JW974_00285 [Alphaproteobacteria bacterium]|nr:hypothetical protein [Alphaproteobacteria bacterium]MBN2675047.1 hypothetical protein [Alphaproteobacteria bacterium]
MKLRYLILPILILSSSGPASAEVTLGVCTLVSCATGYYKNSTVCTACPTPGTSADHNTGAITTCYITANDPLSDTTGTYVYTTNCYYTN